MDIIAVRWNGVGNAAITYRQGNCWLTHTFGEQYGSKTYWSS